jgi:adenylosuccinate synthase
MQSDIVIGLQFGDEGKGKIVYHLIKNGKYNYCVRYNGGPNAGHTVYVGDQKVVTHQIPTGALHGIPSLIGSSCMVDLEKLNQELEMCESHGVSNIRDLVKISYNCHVIQDRHIQQDKSTDTIGSTGCGMGPAYSDKYARTGKRVSDLYPGGKVHGCQIVDPTEYLYQNPNSKILFEGAQGYLLDINWGQYPFVTSTHCDTGFIVSTGVSPRSIRDVYGVAKIYTTYVGTMKYQSDDPVLEQLGTLGGEYGATTGRRRQCNWMNLDLLVKSIRVNGVNKLIVNKCDILDKLGVYKLYYNNKLREFDSMKSMQDFIDSVINEKIVYPNGVGDYGMPTGSPLKITYSSTPHGI